MPDLSNVLQLLAAIFTGIGLYAAWTKIRPETRSIDSQTLERYQKMLDQASIREQVLRDAAEKREIEFQEKEQELREHAEQRETNMQAKMTTIEKRLGDLETQLQAALSELGKVKDWNVRLKAQVESYGETPVPYDPKPRNPTQPRRE
jgi:hypothetical protein